jgi:metal-sulfur cluster biosynthetic enzyme
VSTAVVDERTVLDALNEIIDPCSVRSGVPAGLVDMGLVGDVRVTASTAGACSVSVGVGVTEPGCFMIGPFVTSARERLLQIPGVTDATVTIRSSALWSEDDMRPDYRDRLHRERSRRSGLAVPAGGQG